MNNEIKYKISFSDRKSIGIKIGNDGVVNIIAPINTPDEIIKDVIIKKEAWIKEKVQMIYSRLHLESGTILYKGKKYKLIIKEQIYLKRNFVFCSSNEIIVSVKNRKNLKSTLECWLKKEAITSINTYINKYVVFFDNYPKEVRVKEQKSKWGSCTGDNKLNFNWRLIMAPIKSLEYVVVHEMCHMVHKNHSSAYWLMVSKLMPNYKIHHKWLKDNGYLLYEIEND